MCYRMNLLASLWMLVFQVLEVGPWVLFIGIGVQLLLIDVCIVLCFGSLSQRHVKLNCGYAVQLLGKIDLGRIATNHEEMIILLFY